MKLYKYQEHVVGKMLWAKSLPGNDVVMIAQGGGKSHVIAGLVQRLNMPVLILVPSKELLEQDWDKLRQVVPESEIGVYSASMNRKDVKKYTLATIQSAHKHPDQFAHYEVVIIDECDLVDPKNLEGMYNTFFKAIGSPKIYGLTATPYRQDHYYERYGRGKFDINTVTTTKMIVRYKQRFWSRMLCAINTQDLTDHDYLVPLTYHDESLLDHSQIPINKSRSDFDLDEFDRMIFDRYGGIASWIEGLPHKSIIVYCGSVSQAEALQSLLPTSKVVTGKTPKKEREQATKDLRTGKLRILLNVEVYTVGFDYPALEAVILLRPTRSLRLHSQILGRVSRKAEGKETGHVYDLVSNVRHLGELAEIKVGKNRINGLWDVMSPARPEGFHMSPLYSYRLKK